jgi:CheY-like chemotaxis protein
MPPPKRILVADDQGVNRKLTMRRLEQLGFTVDVVENGLQVLEALNRAQYDLIFMDCHMPDMDGFQAARWIRQRERGERHTPIVAFTASLAGSDRDRCLAAGMDDFVSKPVEESELMRIIRRWLPDARTTDKLVGIDRKELIAIYLADAPTHLAAIRGALSARDARLLADSAHALKSGSGNVGAMQVYELCDQLETIARAGDLAAAGKIVPQLETEFRKLRS